jgi:hypothetical protein
MLQKAFSSQFSPSMPIPLWQEINLRELIYETPSAADEVSCFG